MCERVVTTVDLARLQFATTSLNHVLFVPLTLGLAPLVAAMAIDPA
jgi:cytochrome bd ubiquinol oxidase subunit I